MTTKQADALQMMEQISAGNMANAKAQAIELERFQSINAELLAALVQSIESAGFHVSGPTDSRAAEHGEPAWVCNARLTLARATGSAS